MTLASSPADLRAGASVASANVLAAIDIGSNSFRLEIARLEDGRYRRVDYLKDMVRLGGGLDEEGRLGGEAVERGLACLRRFRTRLGAWPPNCLRAVATQTLREARNRNEFLGLAAEALGHPVEVISGREEARLIYKGVAAMQPGDERRLVVDIGGRSTELILGQAERVIEAESHPVGSVGLSQRFFADGVFLAERFAAAQIAAAAEFEENAAMFSRQHWQCSLGSSGTAGAVSRWLAAHGRGQEGFDHADLLWCRDQWLQAGSVQALRQAAPPGLDLQRAPIIGGGLAILLALFEMLGIERLAPAKGALRQGVILDLAERRAAELGQGPHDLRDDTVAALQRRFAVDLPQATRVREAAQALLGQLMPAAPSELWRELGWVAALHEIGMMVSHHDHHRHTAYLLGHVEAPGFSQDQLRLLGSLALGQRGGLRKVETLCVIAERRAQLLALRLAVVLCHGRVAAPAGLSVSLGPRGRRTELSLRWPSAWAVDLPRTVYLLEQEAIAWARVEGLEISFGAV